MLETAAPPRIVLLDDLTASRIAAGEVVERPASAIKELVENAVDAGATRIDVEWKAAGTEMLRVTDNGCGMTAAEAVLCLQRHATSKIRTAEDLHTVTTLGFRGEALPSIASVSHLRLVTRHSLSEAVEVRVVGGEVEDVFSTAREAGTDIHIYNLFFNQPARAKFLKSLTWESAQSLEVLHRMAMAHPAISFTATVDGREALRTSGSGHFSEAVAETLGSAVAREMVPVTYIGDDVKVHGFVSRPTLTRPTRAGQHFWVNRHPVQNRALLHGFDAGYRAILPTDRHPYAILFVEIAPHAVDMNVHPRKADVRFQREQSVHSAVYHAVRDGLLAADLKPGFETETLLPGPGFGELHPLLPLGHQGPRFLPPETPVHSALNGGPEPALSGTPFVATHQPDAGSPSPPQPKANTTGLPRPYRVLGQVQNTFLVVEGEKGLMLVDQHVAHERVLYEELGRQMEQGTPQSQSLLIPLTVAVDPLEMAAWQQNSAEMDRAGFTIESFGTDSLLVRAVPAMLAKRFSERSMKDLLADLSAGGAVGQRDELKDRILSTAACKAAVKAGDVLEPEEMAGLLDALFTTSNPYLCPHGRPIILHLSVDELMKRFHRT